jgi:hypothetical protein
MNEFIRKDNFMTFNKQIITNNIVVNKKLEINKNLDLKKYDTINSKNILSNILKNRGLGKSKNIYTNVHFNPTITEIPKPLPLKLPKDFKPIVYNVNNNINNNKYEIPANKIPVYNNIISKEKLFFDYESIYRTNFDINNTNNYYIIDEIINS